jgi:hypothetical protein
MSRRVGERGRVIVAVALIAAAVVVPRTLAALSAPHRVRDAAAFNAASCGVERWPVKTLADTAGRRLDLGRIQPTTIGALRRLRVHQGGQSSRGGTAERTVYRVNAVLVAAKVEDDSDIHLVIADPKSGGTMIAELPLLGCTVGATHHARLVVQRARVAFLKACGDSGVNDFAEFGRGSRATVTGVGFFDFDHGQRGVAPNAIELHPVVGFTGRCTTR